MRAVVLRSLAVVGIGAILLAGLLYLASTVDGRPPSVVGIALTQPLPDEATRGLPTTSVEVTFGEPVEQSTAANAFSVQPAVEGSVSWTGSVMIFTPDEPLALESDYTVSIAPSVEDLAGNRMTDSPPAFSFETTGSPELLEATPVDGAIEVALDAPISLRFSTLMDTASVEAALQLRPAFAHETRWSGQLLEIVPIDPLRADTHYRVDIGHDASDVSGVELRSPVELEFRTVEPGLHLSLVVPSDRTDGIAPTSPIAAFFDQPIDPESVSDELFTVTPEVAGSIQLVDELGNAPAEPEDGRVLHFTPSGPLPPNTTFEVLLAPDVQGLDGGGLAEPISWSFTTGAPPSTLSNQITFLSDRAGIANLWAMNPDGTAAHQLSTELTPILDYAVSPNGSSFVVGDGRRLIMAGADGTDARALTEDGVIEFDPSYGPNGQRLAFARADAETGRGLGIWERQIPGGTVTRIELPPDAGVTPSATESSETGQPDDRLRAPRYAPDGEAIAFVDSTGSVAILDLVTEAVTRIRFEAQAAPVWLPDGSAFLLTGRASDRTRDARELDVPVEPLEPGPGSTVAVVERESTIAEESAFGDGASVAAVAADGRIAYLRGDGSLHLTDDASRAGSMPSSVSGERIGAVAFAPGEDAMVIVVLGADGGAETGQGSIERLELGGEGRDVLANDGRRPRWLP
ncbi:MAG: Ig-like domain-containing protein [Candidatus Limnocylindria bacterium]